MSFNMAREKLATYKKRDTDDVLSRKAVTAAANTLTSGQY